MTIRRFVQAALIAGVAFLMMAPSAGAMSVTFQTDIGSMFVSSGTLALNDSTGSAATLTFNPTSGSTVTVPTNINFGIFTLACPSCATVPAVFNPFTFDLVITETSPNGATGTFIGTSLGGSITTTQSTINITWSPAQLGPNGIAPANFGHTIFDVPTFTGIVPPISGDIPGSTSVQGYVTTDLVPEPATLSLIGGALLGLGLFGRKRFFRQ